MYSWIESTFGVADGLARAISFAVSLAVVLVLFALFIFILKRLTGSRLNTVRGRQPRIAVMDTASIDARRRLILIRRDNVEHLVLIGGPTDLVVEQGIVRGQPLSTNYQRTAPGPAGFSAGPALASMDHDGEPTPSPQAGMAAGFAGQTINDGLELPGHHRGRPAAAPLGSPAAETTQVRPNGPDVDPPSAVKKPAASLINAARDALAPKRAPDRDQSPAQARSGSRVPAPSDKPASTTSGTSGTTAAQPRIDMPIGGPAPPAREPGLMSGIAKSLTKPFAGVSGPAPRYGQRVTPPASGPAARARTVLFQPSPTIGRPEPVMEPSAPPPHAKPDQAQTMTAPEPVVSASPATQARSGGGAPAVMAPSSPVSPPSDSVQDPAASAARALNPGESGPGPETARGKLSEATQSAPVETAKADPILDELTVSTGQSEPTGAPVGPVAERQAETIVVPPHPATAATNAAPPVSVDSDRNPIEDEMAKILDEIHGPQRT